MYVGTPVRRSFGGGRRSPAPSRHGASLRSPLRIQPAEVRAFLLDPASPVDTAVLQAAGLAAFAYCTLPTDDPRRAVLRADYLCSLQRHLEMRREIVRLLAVWADAGVEALLFKGFHLAEFLYPHPGMRFHGDIDVLVRPDRVRAAVAAATTAGWGETLSSSRFAHNACELLARAAKVDLHRYVLHCNTPWARVQRRITEAVWELARPVTWEGVTLHVPAAPRLAVASMPGSGTASSTARVTGSAGSE